MIRFFERLLPALCAAIALSPAQLLAADDEQSKAATFQDMVFEGEPVTVELGGKSHQVQLRGTIRVAEDGSPAGSVTASYGTGLSAVISADASTGLSVDVGGTPTGAELRLGTDEKEEALLLGAEKTDFASAFVSFSAELAKSQNVNEWSSEAQAQLVLLALAQSEVWGRNFQAAKARMDAGTGAPILGGIWCKGTAFTVATLVAALLTVGCVAALVPCTVGTFMTIGGFAVPCGILEGLCVGGVFAGWNATYSAMVSLIC